MVLIILSIMGIIVIIGISFFIYFLQKKEEENQELKNIVKNVYKRIITVKNSPSYAVAPEEIREVLDYVAVNTASTTVLNSSSGLLKNKRWRDK